jgi:hypothetical protein
VKSVHPSTLLVVALSATVVQMEGMAGIGNRPTSFQAITLGAAVVATCLLVLMDCRETLDNKNFSALCTVI